MNWKTITKYLIILFWLIAVMAAVLGIVKVYEWRTDSIQSQIETSVQQ